jgi:hypothetical protein
MKEAADSEDEGDPKIIQQKTALRSLAVDWEKTGQITTSEMNEILYTVEMVTSSSGGHCYMLFRA